jgi:hypothetical protein
MSDTCTPVRPVVVAVAVMVVVAVAVAVAVMMPRPMPTHFVVRGVVSAPLLVTVVVALVAVVTTCRRPYDGRHFWLLPQPPFERLHVQYLPRPWNAWLRT